MSKFVELKQRPDDTWWMEIPMESGIMEVKQLPKLSKEQAIREAVRRGYTHVRSWDKTVLAAITSGKASMPNE